MTLMPACCGVVDHRRDVLLVGREDLGVVRMAQAVPDVVDADADGHVGGLEFDHVGIEPPHEVFGLLAADAFVDHLGKLQVGILRREHGIDVAEVSAGRGDRVADGHDLVAGLQLQLLGRVRRGGTDESEDHGENVLNGDLHVRHSIRWAKG